MYNRLTFHQRDRSIGLDNVPVLDVHSLTRPDSFCALVDVIDAAVEVKVDANGNEYLLLTRFWTGDDGDGRVLPIVYGMGHGSPRNLTTHCAIFNGGRIGRDSEVCIFREFCRF